MKADISQLIGKPWKAKTQGPESFDCWGLLNFVYREELGIHLPDFPEVDRETVAAYKGKIEEEAAKTWEPLDCPTHLCAVAMSNSTKFVHHVGIFIESSGGMVLHCHRASGVVYQSIFDIEDHFKLVKFYGLRH